MFWVAVKDPLAHLHCILTMANHTDFVFPLSRFETWCGHKVILPMRSVSVVGEL
jgi:hypothetical protein